MEQLKIGALVRRALASGRSVVRPAACLIHTCWLIRLWRRAFRLLRKARRIIDGCVSSYAAVLRKTMKPLYQQLYLVFCICMYLPGIRLLFFVLGVLTSDLAQSFFLFSFNSRSYSAGNSKSGC